MEIKFTVPGTPRGKQRPKVCRINDRSIAFTPKQTAEHESQIRSIYSKVANFKFESCVPLEIAILALFEPPKSINKAARALMIRSTPRPVGETGVLSNRKKHRGLRRAPSEQADNVFDRHERYAESPEIRVLIKNIME